MAGELGERPFNALLRTRGLDQALKRLLADPASPWWDMRGTLVSETRADTIKAAWQAARCRFRVGVKCPTTYRET